MNSKPPIDCFLIKDNRFIRAIELFNSQKWYQAHDLFEEIWYETSGDNRKIVQAILQIAVGHYHLSEGNINGATILFGEALGKIDTINNEPGGIDIQKLCRLVKSNLINLQNLKILDSKDVPVLVIVD